MARMGIRRTRATVIGVCRFVLEPLGRAGAHVVYNGVRQSQPALPRAPGDPFRIGMIGRIAPQKGQAEFLESARRLRDCRITICGAPLFGDTGYLDEIRKRAEGMPVTFLPWTNQ